MSGKGHQETTESNQYGDRSTTDRTRGLTDHIVLLFISAVLTAVLAIAGWSLTSINNTAALVAAIATNQKGLADTVTEIKKESTGVREALIGLNATFATKTELKEEVSELKAQLKELSAESTSVSERLRLIELRLQRMDNVR